MAYCIEGYTDETIFSMKYEHSIRIQRELIIHRMYCTQQLDPSSDIKGPSRVDR